MEIQQKSLMNKNKVLIIAEAGVNHNGDLKKAIKLIDAAADSGADIVKFQTFKTEFLVSPKAKKAKYQIKNTEGQDNSQFEMLKKLEIPKSWYFKLIEHCKKRNIQFLSSGFDEMSNDFLEELGQSLFKIPSGEITNKPYLLNLAKKRKKVIISTGMSTLEEIEEAVKLFLDNGLTKKMISILHCNTEYPTPFKDVNLNAMNTIKDKLGVIIGYSDHTLGIEVPIAAVAMGAKIIEKHLTLNREEKGPDNKASLGPKGFFEMVKGIRNIEKALGDFKKKPTLSEKKNIAIVRKSIHLKNDLKKGSNITQSDLIMLRPGDGISPMNLEIVIGKKTTKNLVKGKKLNLKDFV